MQPDKILITGGAGFVGSTLAGLFREKYPKAKIVVFDNLKRRGSELNLPRLKQWNVEFVHGDVRNPNDFSSLKDNFDVFIEASAEPSVLAGTQGDSPMYAIDTNLTGTVNCLEFARHHSKLMLFLSTSRVYSVPALIGVRLLEIESPQYRAPRFELDSTHDVVGVSVRGFSEKFPTTGFRSIYGTTKLASEMLIEEYAQAYNLNTVVNRCGVICGPWQMGRVDQGVFSLWMVRHTLGGKLQYTGFGGKGLQVRDLLHPKDLFSLLDLQIVAHKDRTAAPIYNVGGGRERSLSLAQLTVLCRDISGNKIEIGTKPESATVDVPYFVTDAKRAEKEYGWAPKVSLEDMFTEIHTWAKDNKTAILSALG